MIDNHIKMHASQIQKQMYTKKDKRKRDVQEAFWWLQNWHHTSVLDVPNGHNHRVEQPFQGFQ